MPVWIYALGCKIGERSVRGDGIDTRLCTFEKSFFRNWSVFATKTMPFKFSSVHLEFTGNCWPGCSNSLFIQVYHPDQLQFGSPSKSTIRVSSSPPLLRSLQPLIFLQELSSIGNLPKSSSSSVKSCLQSYLVESHSTAIQNLFQKDALSIESRTQKSNLISSLF